MTRTAEKPLFDPPLSDFQHYDLDHPEVWMQFRAMTFDLINKGMKHYGAKAIFETIRFHRIVRYDDQEFKLNNNFTAYYARKFMGWYPQYDGFFELRRAKVNG